jgi:hypothetical protein
VLLVSPEILAQDTEAQSAKPVVVVNNSSNPVPVQAQGTTNVAGSVSVTNTPNVNVTNTPSVIIANTPIVTLSGDSQVSLTTSPGAPLLVRDADLPARRIFQHSGPANDSFTVPAGKVLVIEWVSFDTPVSPNTGPGQMVLYQIGNVAGGQSGFFSYKSDATSNAAPGLDLIVNQQVRIYCDPGSTVFVSARLTFFNNGTVGSHTISGYLVDVP